MVLGSECGGVPVIPMNNCIHKGREEVVWPRILREKKKKKVWAMCSSQSGLDTAPGRVSDKSLPNLYLQAWLEK